MLSLRSVNPRGGIAILRRTALRDVPYRIPQRPVTTHLQVKRETQLERSLVALSRPHVEIGDFR